jgi:hypothetical protein
MNLTKKPIMNEDQQLSSLKFRKPQKIRKADQAQFAHLSYLSSRVKDRKMRLKSNNGFHLPTPKNHSGFFVPTRSAFSDLAMPLRYHAIWNRIVSIVPHRPTIPLIPLQS